MTTIVWFRNDLRLADHPALHAGASAGQVVPVYILEEASPGRGIGGASKWWLHRSLEALRKDLGGLVLERGDPAEILARLARRMSARAVYWNRCYEPAGIHRDRSIRDDLEARGVEVRTFKAALLHEPWDVATGSGGPFKVYSPFWRACLGRDVGPPLDRPKLDIALPGGKEDRMDERDLSLTTPVWARGWGDIWRPGEAGAIARLRAFVDTGLAGYAVHRDRPDLANVSRLSPHIHFGEISPRQIWAEVSMAAQSDPGFRRDAEKFLAEIGWREFSHHLLYHFPELPRENWKPEFDSYPWQEDAGALEAWQRGMTGYPLVDAGMRELWQTGYMHNRVRMVAASFLVKHLRLHWRHGEAWFWDTLVDADLANNAAAWQWVAGSGADASPYFRIFNPVLQGEKFDPAGDYVRRWCPELAGLDARFIHKPFVAPVEALAAAGIRLAHTYPEPIVDHGAARRAALAGYEQVRSAAGR